MLLIASGRADTTKSESRANVGLSCFGRITLFQSWLKTVQLVNCFPISNLIKEENQVAVVGPPRSPGLSFYSAQQVGTFCDENLLNLLNFLNFMS